RARGGKGNAPYPGHVSIDRQGYVPSLYPQGRLVRKSLVKGQYVALPPTDQQGFAIGRPGQRTDWSHLRDDRRVVFVQRDVPDQHDPTITGRGQERAIRRPGHRPHSVTVMSAMYELACTR